MALGPGNIRPPVNKKEAVPGSRGEGKGTKSTSSGKTITTAKNNEK
jgi:hypothetical protein